MSKTIKHFLQHIHKRTKQRGYRIVFKKGRFIKIPSIPSCPVCGYFDAENQVIYIAKDHPLWLSNLVHEYCHFEQEISPKHNHKYDYVYDVVDNWAEKKQELPPSKIRKYVRIIRDDELDCEQRAVKLIKDFNLPIDLKRYIKKANLYLYFHLILERHRFLPASSLCPLWKRMPAHFENNYNRIPRGLSEDFKKILKS
jgi:hypothetical protein